jgi:hypothetical protein
MDSSVLVANFSNKLPTSFEFGPLTNVKRLAGALSSSRPLVNVDDVSRLLDNKRADAPEEAPGETEEGTDDNTDTGDAVRNSCCCTPIDGD